MSVESSTDDSSDSNESEQSAFEVAVEAVMSELDQRFQEHSRTYTLGDSQQLHLIPEHRWINSGGEETHYIHRLQYELLRSHGFTPSVVNDVDRGAGLKFTFDFNE